MKILLIGEYSRLHLGLAEGLRVLGHQVVVASDGDGFKDYERDVDLTRKSSSLLDTFTSLASILRKFSRFRGYDIVQLINPCFTTQHVMVNRYLYKQLKKNNAKVYLGAFGDDSYWVRACMSNRIFKYSEFFVNGKSTELKYNEKLITTWIDTPREVLNNEIASSANGIAACLYEYYKSYEELFASKLAYLPLPVNTDHVVFEAIKEPPQKVNFFIGINKDRAEYKGTDIMERALIRLADKYPDQVNVLRVESVSYEVYKQKMSEAHVVLDQLYSYTPAMNALLAMAQGKVLVGGGEPEMYDLTGEYENRPIVNVFPTEDDVFDKLEMILLNKTNLPEMSHASRAFVEKHHDYVKVAREYVDFWSGN